MKRKVLGMAMIAGFGTLALLTAFATPVFAAEVNVNINIGAPPPVVVHERPTMLYLPEPGLYVAVGIPYDIYFVSGRYYYLRGSDWFWAPGYGGPWVFVGHVGHSSLPPGLRKFKVKDLHSFREREYRVYQTAGPGYRGKSFRGESHPGENDQGEDHGNGRSKSKGRGKH